MFSVVVPKRPAFARWIPDTDLLIVSTYQLDDPESRSGSLHLFDKELKPIQEIKQSAGVFRFEKFEDSSVISALTDGSLAISKLNGEYATRSIPVVTDKMLLDVSVSHDKALTTSNNGKAYVVDLSKETTTTSWEAHKYDFSDSDLCEVWCCSMSKNNSQVACTGGEDAKVQLYDVKGNCPVGKYAGCEAGVTFVDWQNDTTIIVGSYDESIRILDTRQLKSAVSEVKTTGGVWSIERRELDSTVYYMAALMYGGWMVLNDQWEPILTDEEAGEQLLYGATLVDKHTVVATTFNDYKVTRFDIDFS